MSEMCRASLSSSAESEEKGQIGIYVEWHVTLATSQKLNFVNKLNAVQTFPKMC